MEPICLVSTFIDDLPPDIMLVNTAISRNKRIFLKRLFDIVVSFLGLIFLSPLFLVIAINIKLHMPGPVLFHQKRAGRYGRPFTISKFRTMILNHGGCSISIKGEARITKLGALLRKYKLDELPELWNVLIGEMSLVGPRPDLTEYAEKLINEERLILELRPGITGLATLKYSNEEELLACVPDPQKYNDNILWPDKIKLNLIYYYNRNFSGDVNIILRTIFLRTSLFTFNPTQEIATNIIDYETKNMDVPSSYGGG